MELLQFFSLLLYVLLMNPSKRLRTAPVSTNSPYHPKLIKIILKGQHKTKNPNCLRKKKITQTSRVLAHIITDNRLIEWNCSTLLSSSPSHQHKWHDVQSFHQQLFVFPPNKGKCSCATSSIFIIRTEHNKQPTFQERISTEKHRVVKGS